MGSQPDTTERPSFSLMEERHTPTPSPTVGSGEQPLVFNGPQKSVWWGSACSLTVQSCDFYLLIPQVAYTPNTA